MNDLLTEAYHIMPARISQTLEAVVATENVAQQLRVNQGFPLLLLSRVTFEEEEGPVIFSQDFLRGDYARIHTDTQLLERNPSVEEDRAGKEGVRE